MPLDSVKPSIWLILRVWFSFGVQSFGGGAATLALIRRGVVEQHGWLTPEEFTRDWALCQVAPGINLLAMTTLIGKRVAGIPGVVAALLGLLVSSVAITVLITASYAQIKTRPEVQSALLGVIPATVGLGLITACQMAKSELITSKKEGSGSFLLALTLLIICGLAVRFWNLPVILVLFAAGIISALYYWQREKSENSKAIL